jgi:hypothetical protein
VKSDYSNSHYEEEIMKKIAIGILTLLLFVSALWTAQAAPGDAALTPKGEEGGFVSMAAMGDTLYLLSATGLYTWRPGEAEPSLLGTMPEDDPAEQGGQSGVSIAGGGVMMVRNGGGLIDHLLVWENKLYGLNSEDGSVYLMEVTDGKVNLTKAQSLAWQAMKENQGGISFPAMISDITVVDGYLYLLKAEMDATANELLRFNFADGGFIKYDASLVAGFAPYKEGKALIMQYVSEQDAMAQTGKLWLNVLDIDTGVVTKGLELPVSLAEGLAYDANSDTAAFFSGGEIYAVDQIASCRLAGYAPAAYQGITYNKALFMPNSLYTLNGEQVSVRSIAKGESILRALRIQNASEQSYKEFAVKRPDIPVVLKNTPFSSAEMLMQDMATGSSDLYSFKIDELDYHSLIEKGYTASLSGSNVLMDMVREMYPFLQKELYRGEDLAAFPVTLTGQTLGYSKKALSELGLTEEDLPHTFPELLDFITNWDADYGVDHPSLALFRDNLYGDSKQMFMGILIQYYSAYYQKLGENLTFDTPLMEKLLAALEAADFSALKTKDVQQAMTGAVTYTFTTAGGAAQPAKALFTMYQEAVLSEYGFMMSDFVPLPLSMDEGLDPIVPASLTVYVINPYSPNQDLAIAYLEHFAGQRSKVSLAAMSPDYNEPVISPMYETRKAQQEKELSDIKTQLETAPADKKKELEESFKAAEDQLAFLESIKWQVSMQDLEAYRERVNWLTVNNINPLTLLAQDQAMTALMGRYTAGQIDTRELLNTLEQKLQMIYREGK